MPLHRNVTLIILSLQFHHCIYIWKTFWNTPGFCNKLSVLFKGPGWGPGKPRLGLMEDIPEVSIAWISLLGSVNYVFIRVQSSACLPKGKPHIWGIEAGS